jgi:hypothetical protein
LRDIGLTVRCGRRGQESRNCCVTRIPPIRAETAADRSSRIPNTDVLPWRSLFGLWFLCVRAGGVIRGSFCGHLRHPRSPTDPSRRPAPQRRTQPSRFLGTSSFDLLTSRPLGPRNHEITHSMEKTLFGTTSGRHRCPPDRFSQRTVSVHGPGRCRWSRSVPRIPRIPRIRPPGDPSLHRVPFAPTLGTTANETFRSPYRTRGA